MMSRLVPNLRYREPKRAAEWLAKAFGFGIREVVEIGDAVTHVEMSFGGDLIYLSRDSDYDRYGMHSPMGLNGTNQSVCVVLTGNVDGACERARSAGAEIMTEPYNTPFGSRDFVCRDLEGHIWTLGTYSGSS